MSRYTQASGDGGVDVVVNDPTPLSGGIYIVQVKRYKGTVSPDAVRALYGVMRDNRASKGFLVTTGGFGHESQFFADDKPIDLIDGPALVDLFFKHGYRVRNQISG